MQKSSNASSMRSRFLDNTPLPEPQEQVTALRSIDPRGVPFILAPGLSILLEPRFFLLLFLAVLCYVISSFVGNEWCYLIPASLLAALILGVALPILEMQSIAAECKIIYSPNTKDDTSINVTIRRKTKLKILSRLIPAGYLGAYLVLAQRTLSKWPSAKMRLPIPAVIDSLTHGFNATLSVPPLTRGVYKVEHIEVASCFPFGVAWCLRTIEMIETAHDTITVYPTLYPVGGNFQSRLSVNSESAGRMHQQLLIAESMNIRGVREFTERDNLTHIHWSLSARTGNLMVRQFEPESQAEFDLVLDAGETWTIDQFELAVSTVWSLMQYACRMSFQPELFTLPGDSPELLELLEDIPGGLAGRQLAAEVLARIQPVERSVAPPTASPTAGRSLLAVMPDGNRAVSLVEVAAVSSTGLAIKQVLGRISDKSEIVRL